MNNQPIYIERSRSRYEPHVLEDIDVVDPIKNHKSDTWRFVLVVTCLIEVCSFVLFFVSLNKNFLFKIWIFNPMSFLLILIFLINPILWFAVAGTQRRLDGNVNKVKFKNRVRNKVDTFSKWDDKTPEKSIRAITGIKTFDPETGLSEHEVNERKWSFDEHPYLGNWAYDVIAYVKTTDDEEVIIENLFEAGKTLKEGGILIRTSMYSGESIVNNLENIERQLAEPDISDIRQKALYSVYNHYVGREGNCEPIYCIHFGLPFTTSKEKAMEYMRVIRDEFESALNERGIETVLIKDFDIMKAIIEGIFTGKMYFTGDINEN